MKSLNQLFQETFILNMDEDAPANNAGGGNIAGIGVGPQGEPGVPKAKKLKRALFRRKDGDGLSKHNSS